MQVYQAHGENGQSRQAQPQSIPASIVSDLADLHSATMPSPSIWFALLDQCRLSGRAFVHSIANLRHKGACSAHAREEYLGREPLDGQPLLPYLQPFESRRGMASENREERP
eukprot:scaffold154469_cov31-Tisochrysis_lutea.AAC.2